MVKGRKGRKGNAPLHEEEPQLTATRSASELTEIEFVVPMKFTPCTGRGAARREGVRGLSGACG